MSSGTTAVSDVIVPQIFSPYVQLLTQEKSRLVQSGALARDAALDEFLAGGGLTANMPSWKDLDDDTDNVSSDTTGTSSPNKIGSVDEIVVRLSRNNSWATADLSSALAGSDPANAIASRVAAYWVRRLQAAFVATMTGVFAQNVSSDSSDMVHDISGVSFADGVTNFSAEAVIDTAVTMGDSMDQLSMIFVHSVVYARMQKNNLIDFIPDSEGKVNIPTFLGREVIVDDGMPVTSGVYESWLFGAGAVRLGMGSPKVPTEVIRIPSAGNGGGQEQLYNRTEWVIHPVGHKYAGTAANGGPSNASSSNNLAASASWDRVYPERKQVKMARLITRES
jgi:hypothetical protein